MMAALFACTKCHKRHPFEELSQAEQLCKECRNHFPVVKCTYCRAEFQQEEKGSTNSICKKCAQNVKLYGKPTVCEYCNILAAFIGNKCQRCTNSERRWGSPSTCEQCKQKCAFDRTDGSRKKVDGKLLCWLCTLAYKRVLAKARIRQDEAKKNLSSQKNTQKNSEEKADKHDKFDSIMKSNKSDDSSKFDSAGSTSSRHSNGSQGDGERVTGNSQEEKSSSENKGNKNHHKHKHHHHHHHHHHRHKHHHKHKSSEPNTPTGTPPKVSRLDSKSNANGLTPTKRNNESSLNSTSPEQTRFSFLKTSTGLTSSLSMTSLSILNTSALDKSVDDPHSSEHLIALQQLQEQLDAAKKQVQAKDQQLLEKDKKITELKAQLYEQDKEFRTKMQSSQKQHSDSIESILTKNRELMKQVATLSKGKNKTSTASPSIGT